jgi:hypothetical protein
MGPHPDGIEHAYHPLALLMVDHVSQHVFPAPQRSLPLALSVLLTDLVEVYVFHFHLFRNIEFFPYISRYRVFNFDHFLLPRIEIILAVGPLLEVIEQFNVSCI